MLHWQSPKYLTSIHKTALCLDYISELRIHITLAIFKSVTIQSFQPKDINRKVYMCTSIVNNFSNHVSVDTDITYWKNKGRYMNIQYVGHRCKYMKIMKHIYQI